MLSYRPTVSSINDVSSREDVHIFHILRIQIIYAFIGCFIVLYCYHSTAFIDFLAKDLHLFYEVKINMKNVKFKNL